jgi:phosphoesterase RecJ-like protein
MNDDVSQIKKLVKEASNILIVQADNPDGDSLASSLALEQIFHDLGKQPHLYCAIDIPKHLRHLQGWDRIEKDIPHNYDLSIVVDCSSRSLLEVAENNGQLSWLLAKPMIIIDHHDVEATLEPTVYYNQTQAVATGEVIYQLAQKLKWPLNRNAMNMITVSILSDSLGLMTDATTPTSIRIVADLVEQGVKLPELEEARRETMRKSQELVRYKGELLQRVEYSDNGRIASIIIPWEEIEKYSSHYNPSMLVIDDMRLTDNVAIAIAFKTYPDGRVTAKIRANYGFGIANKLAEHFGGGGHPYASGFKITGKPFNQIKSDCIHKAIELLNNLNKTTS